MKQKGKNLCRLLLIPLIMGMVIGCASSGTDLVIKQVSNVEMLINRAKQNDAEKYAPLELKLAEDKLREAKKALAEDEPEIASSKAEEAMMDAKVADAKAQAQKSKKRVKDEQKDVDMLRNEIERSQSD